MHFVTTMFNFILLVYYSIKWENSCFCSVLHVKMGTSKKLFCDKNYKWPWIWRNDLKSFHRYLSFPVSRGRNIPVELGAAERMNMINTSEVSRKILLQKNKKIMVSSVTEHKFHENCHSVTSHCTGQFTPKMKANAEPRLLSSLVWIDSGVVVSQHRVESFFMK